MASLFNTRISDTYQGLIKTIDNAAITATLKELTDGSGNSTGISLNNAGDFKVNAILEFGSLKDTGENIIITKFVDEADGIANNDNDTSIPTTAAIIDYVAAQITIEDLDFTGDSGSGQIDLDSQIFAIGGTTNEITTVASGQSLTLSLDSTGVNLPDNSTAITQTAGDNSTKIATTSYVDTLDAASDLDITDGTNVGDINLNTQSLSILGTTNEIETVVSGQGVTIGLPSTINTNLVGNVTGDLTGNVTGNVTGDLTGNVTSTSVLANGVTATTQTSSDDSTKVATTAYVKGLNNASDLDFTTDSGSGAVVLNSETLRVVGTTNEIETSGTGQEIQIGLPNSISTNLVGNVIGNLTGNVVGDVTGDLTGNSAGTHTGAVIGNVTGNVTGDLTGNADTATAWETARDLSLTGQATGTISSVDGTGNVSGALTLDNNSVTGKVLTGLTSPSASSVLATDTIVEGFGKLQSQVNGLAGGLRFMGSWDADTNSPVLSSGGGEAANGTTTSTTANKLVDSSASFTSTVTVGDQVVNQVDGQTALVSNVDSDTTLSLDADIMLTGEAYTIDNSPFITQGHYYVVSVGGTTTLNGVSNWTIGDWVIAGANNQWTKLDHSQVDGTGTTGNLTKWSSTSVIADSIVSESGTAITVDGSLTTNTNLSSTGNFTVNTNKFTVAAASGNTAFTGDLAINTDKFTVNATTGNTLVAGTLDVTGKSTFGDDITISDSTPILDFEDTDNTNSNWRMEAKGSFGGFFLQSFDNNFQTGSTVLFAKTSNGYIGLGGNTNPQAELDITGGLITSGNATFGGDVTANVGTFNSDSGGTGLKIIGRSAANAGTLRYYQNNGTTQTARIESNDSIFEINSISNLPIELKTNDTTALTIDTSQNSTFAGNVTASRGFFNAGATNVVATFTSTDATSTLQCIDGVGNVEFGASGNDFVVQPAGGVAQLTVGSSSSTFGGAVRINATTTTGLVISSSSSASNGLKLYNNSSTDNAYIYNHFDGNLEIGTNNATVLTMNGTNSTFAGDVTTNTNFTALDGTSLLKDTNAYPLNLSRGLDVSSVGAASAMMGIGSNVGTTYTDAMRVGGLLQGNGVDGDAFIMVRNSGTMETAMTIDSTKETTFAGDVVINKSSGKIDFRNGSGSSRYFLELANSNNDLQINDRTGVGAVAMTIQSGGNVGIGTDSPQGKLNVTMGVGTNGAELQRWHYSTTPDRWNLRLTQVVSGNDVAWDFKQTNNNTDYGSVLTLKNGYVGIGTDSPQAQFCLNNQIANSGTPLNYSTVQQNVLNGYYTTGESPNRYTRYFDIACVGDGDGTNGGGNIRFLTNPIANDTATEKMRITSGGAVEIASISGSSVIDYGMTLAPASGYAQIYLRANTTSTRYLQRFYNESSGVLQNVGNITISGSSTNYVTSSDYRLKEDLQDFAGLDMVSKIPVYDFKWKTDESRSYGVMAHELQEVLPDAVSGNKDAINEDESINPQGVDYSKIVPLLVKSIQELKAEVDKLKQECKCKN